MPEVKIKPGKYGQAIGLLLRMGGGFQTRYKQTLIVDSQQRRILDGVPGDPQAVFLWLSDSPELNEQSKNKIENASDVIPSDRLKTIEHPFNVDRLAAGWAARTRAENTRLTTVQRFVKGDKSVGLAPRSIIGISATPQRFYAVLKDTTGRFIKSTSSPRMSGVRD